MERFTNTYEQTIYELWLAENGRTDTNESYELYYYIYYKLIPSLKG